MVSTLGALTGIAIGSNNYFFIILSGFVIVAVEATSMGVGAYLSTKSVIDVNKRKLEEKQSEFQKDLRKETEALIALYTKEGWPLTLAKEMAAEASKNKNLFLQEVAYRELDIQKKNRKTFAVRNFYVLFLYNGRAYSCYVLFIPSYFISNTFFYRNYIILIIPAWLYNCRIYRTKIMESRIENAFYSKHSCCSRTFCRQCRELVVSTIK